MRRWEGLGLATSGVWGGVRLEISEVRAGLGLGTSEVRGGFALETSGVRAGLGLETSEVRATTTCPWDGNEGRDGGAACRDGEHCPRSSFGERAGLEDVKF